MAIKSFNEILEELKTKQEKYNNCEHELEDKSCGFITLGRFGGNCIKLYKCKKCSVEFTKDNKYLKEINYYDKGGRLKNIMI